MPTWKKTVPGMVHQLKLFGHNLYYMEVSIFFRYLQHILTTEYTSHDHTLPEHRLITTDKPPDEGSITVDNSPKLITEDQESMIVTDSHQKATPLSLMERLKYKEIPIYFTRH